MIVCRDQIKSCIALFFQPSRTFTGVADRAVCLEAQNNAAVDAFMIFLLPEIEEFAYLDAMVDAGDKNLLSKAAFEQVKARLQAVAAAGQDNNGLRLGGSNVGTGRGNAACEPAQSSQPQRKQEQG